MALPDHRAAISQAKEVTDSIADFIDALNRADQARAIAHLTDDVTIIEDVAPFRWSGPNAGQDWMVAMWGRRKNMSAVSMEIAAPSRIEIEGSAAYAVVPALLTYVGATSTLRSEGLLTFSLQANDGQWLISGLAWGGPEAG